jgi:hypothetical protein
VSLWLFILLAWAGLAFLMIATVLVLTARKEPPRYLRLIVVAEPPPAQNMNEAERKAA